LADPEIQSEIKAARAEMASARIKKNEGRERLADLRLLAGLSQEGLAAEIGTSQPRLSRWEAGKDRPTYENIVALAGALNVDFNRLHRALAHV
jgi:DNA-binding XRE family transcriptional regulator